MVNKNYIIQAHQSPQLLDRLINRLNDGFSTFFIHIDAKVDIKPFTEAIKGNNIRFIEKRVDCIWGDYSQVEATFNLIEAVINSKNEGVTIFLSGQDYPIKSNEYINQFLSSNKNDFMSFLHQIIDKNSVLYKQRLKLFKINLANKRDDFIIIGNPIYMNIENWKRLVKKCFKGKFKYQYLKYFFKERDNLFDEYGKGSQWWAFQNETLNLIYNYINNNKYELDEYFKYSFAVDEIFFHTIYLKLFNNHIPNENLHYINWEKKGVSLPLTFLEEDIHYFKNLPENKLYARKFDTESQKVYDWINNNLL